MRVFTAAAALLATLGCTPGGDERQPSPATVWRPVASWSGRETTTLETFPISAGRLRLHWSTFNESPPGSGRFKLRLHSADSGRVLEEPVDARGVGGGTIDVYDEHLRFYLSVESTNVDWSVRVEEGVRSGH